MDIDGGGGRSVSKRCGGNLGMGSPGLKERHAQT